MMTINQEKQLFNNIADAHYQIHDFHFGSFERFEEKFNSNAKYPMLAVFPMESVTLQQTKTRKYFVLVIDIPKKDKSNLADIWSDTEQIMDDLVRIFRKESKNYQLVGEPILSPVDEKYSDWCSGYQTELTIETDFDSNNCEIPASSFVSPEYSAVWAVLKDQDGNVIKNLTKGEVYNVIIADTIQGTINGTISIIPSI